MFTETYELCGVPVQITAPRPVKKDAQAELFCKPLQTADLHIALEPADELPEPQGTLCGQAGEKTIWRSGSRITRQTKDLFRPAPHIQAQYDLTDPGRVCALVRREDWDWAAGTKYLWTGIAVNQLMLHFRTLFFHASCIEYRGQAILFTAPSGTGKSTQAELWKQYRGAQVLNGDKAAVSLREAPMAHGIPFSGTSGICRAFSLPLRAVVVLSQAPENTVRRMKPVEIVTALCPNVFADKTVPEEWSMTLTLLLDLAAAVPVYALACTPDERAVTALDNVLF